VGLGVAQQHGLQLGGWGHRGALASSTIGTLLLLAAGGQWGDHRATLPPAAVLAGAEQQWSEGEHWTQGAGASGAAALPCWAQQGQGQGF